MGKYDSSKYYTTTKEERIEEVLKKSNTTNKPINKLTEYLRQENVKKYNAILTDKALNMPITKANYILNTEELEGEVKDYFTLCYDCDIIPTVQNLCTYIGVHRNTVYERATKSDRNGYILKNAIELCHANLQNGSIAGSVNSLLYIFLSKNYHDMHDNSTVNLTSTLLDNPNSNQTMSIIKEQLELENNGKN